MERIHSAFPLTKPFSNMFQVIIIRLDTALKGIKKWLIKEILFYKIKFIFIKATILK